MSGAKKKLARREAKAQMGLSEREKQELRKQKAQKRNTILAIVGGAIAVVLVVALLVWNSGVIDRHKTVLKFRATQGKVSTDVLSLTQADMDYYYYQAINRLANLYTQAGLDYTVAFDPSGDLKKQYVEEGLSYDEYFKQQALADVQEVISLYNAAKAEGYTLSEEAQANLNSAKADLDSMVAQSGLGSRSNYLRAVYGRAMTEKIYLRNMERSLLASDYYNYLLDSLGDTYTDAELEAYYGEHADELDSYDFDYAYFDGTAQPELDENGNTIDPTDEENAAALAQAKESADAMLAALRGDTTVTVTTDEADSSQLQTKDFVTLAETFGTTGFTQTDAAGDYFTGAPFDTWLTDSARVNGDAEVFELEGTGYYIVQFHNRYRSDTPDSADVRHILIAADTDEELEAAYAEAQRIMEEFTSGEQTSERFAELAEEYSDDGRDEEGNLVSPGGLYEDVTPTTNFVQEFLDWIFVPERKAGDVGIVQTMYGYHVMYADRVDEVHWIAHAREALASEAQSDLVEEIKSRYEISSNKWCKAPAQETEEEPAQEGTEN